MNAEQLRKNFRVYYEISRQPYWVDFLFVQNPINDERLQEIAWNAIRQKDPEVKRDEVTIKRVEKIN